MLFAWEVCSFHKDKIDGSYEAAKSGNVVPMESLALEEHGHDDGEYEQGDDFLNHLELNERERTAVFDEAYAIGGNLANILKEGYAPREGDDCNQGPTLANACFAQLEVAVPGYCHEDVRADE